VVAKTFQSYEIVGLPYEASKRMYVRVRNPKTLKERVVRWYSETEYNKLYPDEAAVKVAEKINYRKILGFEKGYIHLFRGVSDLNEEYISKIKETRYHDWWGWYLVSTEELSSPLPVDVEMVKLNWEDIAADDITIKGKNDVRRVVEELLYASDVGKFVGNIGDRLELTLFVRAAIPLESQYGHSTLHIFEDQEKNEYVWTTAARTLSVGETYTLRGNISDQRIYKGRKQNILKNCRIQ
jgi:hypothetical protein